MVEISNNVNTTVLHRYAATMQAGVLAALRGDLKDLEAANLKPQLCAGPDTKRHVVAVSDSDIEVGPDPETNLSVSLRENVMTALRFDLVKDLLESGQVRLT